jgi:hypothetical protein
MNIIQNGIGREFFEITKDIREWPFVRIACLENKMDVIAHDNKGINA